MIRIMLVEDEKVIREGISALISQGSPRFTVVQEVSNGREALQYLERNAVDMVITDIRMHEMGGLELLEKIRSQFEDMPLLIISGYDDFTYARRALQYGVTDYLLKPIDRRQLVSALDKIHTQMLKKSGRSPEQKVPPEETTDKKQAGAEGSRLVRKVKEYIGAHPEGDLRLQTLADLVHLNPAYLSQLFKQEDGANLSDYITASRMERAKYLLVSTELKIYDVARLSGYQSPKHFMLVFKQQCGVTPGAYRSGSV
jgi:two-component system, response regulator YesN